MCKAQGVVSVGLPQARRIVGSGDETKKINKLSELFRGGSKTEKLPFFGTTMERKNKNQ